jgi:hypothetical protein
MPATVAGSLPQTVHYVAVDTLEITCLLVSVYLPRYHAGTSPCPRDVLVPADRELVEARQATKLQSTVK